MTPRLDRKPVSIRNSSMDPLCKAVVQYSLNGKESVFLDDASADTRFTSEAEQSPYSSVICLPLFSYRGQTLGALYMSSKTPFPPRMHTVMTLLVQQGSISIGKSDLARSGTQPLLICGPLLANALLFRSVQSGTRENLKMIQTQREALEAARKSREEALQATKVSCWFVCKFARP